MFLVKNKKDCETCMIIAAIVLILQVKLALLSKFCYIKKYVNLVKYFSRRQNKMNVYKTLTIAHIFRLQKEKKI